MHTEIVYIFPDTLPRDDLVFPLAQIFKQVFFLRPVENDPPEPEDLTSLLREMTEEQYIGFDCPAPLLGDRDRFLQLLRDIRYRPDDYTGHLGSLSAGPDSIGGQQESEEFIMHTLLRQTGIQAGAIDRTENTLEYGKEQEEKQASMLLWQARLLLKLGEAVNRKREQIQRNLDRIALREKELLRELRKEQGETREQTPSSQHTGYSGSEEIPLSQLRLRLKAWSRLFAVGQQPQRAVFVTRSVDAFELLIEHYRQEYTAEPKHLLTFPLPAVMTENDCIEKRRCFQMDTEEFSALIRGALNKPLFFEERKEEWAAVLEQHYPTTENGRCRLSLYFLPAITPQEFFLDTFSRRAGGNMSGHREERPTGTGAVIGILEELTDTGDNV
ncbi:MAG: hypothetical protein D3924_10700 [Candidatus Electrothrix sp. AR4]|nr:hypothetical protein [Candidatus Electrothrix sp. AR4]